MSDRVSVAARCPRGPLAIEPWKGRNKDGHPDRFVVLRVLSNGRSRMWLMLNPDEWEELKHLVDEDLKTNEETKGV